MHFQIENLEESNTGLLPEHCQACGWWQGYDNGWPSHKAAAAWGEEAMDQFGYWGKLAIGDDELLGFIQFGPADLFARAGEIAGDEARDSVLLACSEVSDKDITSLRKSLLIAAMAELRQREVEQIDAFCSANGQGNNDCRLFSRKFLSDCGFTPVKQIGDLVMMRLELGGAQPVRYQREKARHRLLERIRRRHATPSPAAMCRKSGRSKSSIAVSG